jgi:hypothetical protein
LDDLAARALRVGGSPVQISINPQRELHFPDNCRANHLRKWRREVPGSLLMGFVVSPI